MHGHLFRSAAIACLAWAALTAAAAADPAPIVYAGQGEQGASPRPISLVGGGENSYGYGASSAPRGEGAVIDIRRPATVTPVRDDGPVTLTPAEAANEDRPAPPAEQGTRPGWLEQERVGPPYQANGRWYVPTPEPGYEQTGAASWYGPQFHGQRTANGEVFDQQGMTAAHPTLPLNSLVQVTNLDNGREVIVRVTDRGPFVGERLIDLSRGAAEALDFVRAGHARVHVRYLGPAPRRVNAGGSSAPAPSPTPTPPPGVEDGEPASLLPPSPAGQTELAGGYVQPPTAPPTAGYFVQVGAFSDLSNAHRVRDTVGAAGPVTVDVRQTANGELFRVRIGPLATQEDAAAAQHTLASLGYSQTIVAAR